MKYRNTVLACVISLVAVGATAADQTPESAGPYSAAALYNSANGFARAGKPGLAILNYERARLLSPADPDIDANLQSVRESQHLSAVPAPLVERVLGPVSPSVAALLGLCGVLLVIGSIAAPAKLRRMRALRMAIGLLGTALCAGIALYGNMQWQMLHSAVVVTGPASVRATPVSMAETLFTLVEGDIVRVTATHDDYALVEDRSGKTGWVESKLVMPIVPATQAGTT